MYKIIGVSSSSTCFNRMYEWQKSRYWTPHCAAIRITSMALSKDTVPPGTHYVEFCQSGSFVGAGPKDATQDTLQRQFWRKALYSPQQSWWEQDGLNPSSSVFACMQSRMPPPHCEAVLPDALPSIVVAVSGSLVQYFCCQREFRQCRSKCPGRTPPNSIRISPPSHLHPPTHLHLHATAGVSQCILAHCNTNIYLLMHR